MSGTPGDEQERRLVHVRYAGAAVAETQRSLREAVAAARQIGVSWERIGEALGIGRGAARSRFAANHD